MLSDNTADAALHTMLISWGSSCTDGGNVRIAVKGSIERVPRFLGMAV